MQEKQLAYLYQDVIHTPKIYPYFCLCLIQMVGRSAVNLLFCTSDFELEKVWHLWLKCRPHSL